MEIYSISRIARRIFILDQLREKQRCCWGNFLFAMMLVNNGYCCIHVILFSATKTTQDTILQPTQQNFRLVLVLQPAKTASIPQACYHTSTKNLCIYYSTTKPGSLGVNSVASVWFVEVFQTAVAISSVLTDYRKQSAKNGNAE